MLVKVILLGPPGAGKGTQAKSICNKYRIPHISTGDIFRKHISELTPLGVEVKSYMDNGLLVPDRLTIDIVSERLGQDDCKNGFLLDGFPRTVVQAEALDLFLSNTEECIDVALLIKVPNEFIIERMTGRRVCPSCGASYHLRFNPPKLSSKCDVCGTDLMHRKDDEEQTVVERLDVYNKQTEPLIKFYEAQGKLAEVDGTKPINEVFKSICSILGSDS